MITLGVDHIRQQPVIARTAEPSDVRTGTSVRLSWPDSARSILDAAKRRFLQLAHDYTVLNPHLTLSVDWEGERTRIAASQPAWAKWRPSDPTSAHWYRVDQLARSMAQASGGMTPLRNMKQP